jgi:hypothetical protein
VGSRHYHGEEAPINDESTVDLGTKVDDGPSPRYISGTHRTNLVTQVDGRALFRYTGPVVMEGVLCAVLAASG